MRTLNNKNRIDGFNEIVENALGMKAKKTPWHLRFAQKAKGLVSFVQNLLSPLTQKEASAAASVLVGIGFLKTKKAVSAVAAAVVGVGLLCSPIESVQANHGQSNVPIVFEVDIDTDAGNASWTLSADRWPLGYCVVRNPQSVSSPVIYAGGYFQVTLYPYVGTTLGGRPICLASQWIELWVWMGDDDSEPSAYVYDSDGNSYDVDLYVDDYGPWPASW